MWGRLAISITDKLSLPPDLANGLIPMLLSDIAPRAEATLSLLISTPKPRVVTLRIAASEPDSFSPILR